MLQAAFLFENVSDPIMVLDRDFRVVRVNPAFCRFFDVAEDQVLGKVSCDVFRELDYRQGNEACMRIMQAEAEGGKLVEVPDEHCPHFDHAYPIFDEDGRLQEAMFIVKTEGRQGTAAAGRGNPTNNRDETLATIYHDLASPLQVIRACTDVLSIELDDVPDDKKDIMRDMVEAAKRNERRLYEMVRTIRMIPGLEEDALYPSVPVRPREIVKTVCTDFRLLLRDDVTLEWNVPREIPDVVGARNLLDRMLFNLLDNAARYTHRNGSISVSVDYQPGDTHVTFKVFDDGESIPPDLLPHLFDKNVSANPGTRLTWNRTDHGWGLYFCRLTVERLGGSISVRSEDGWGTEFTFTLPVAEG